MKHTNTQIRHSLYCCSWDWFNMKRYRSTVTAWGGHINVQTESYSVQITQNDGISHISQLRRSWGDFLKSVAKYNSQTVTHMEKGGYQCWVALDSYKCTQWMVTQSSDTDGQETQLNEQGWPQLDTIVAHEWATAKKLCKTKTFISTGITI